MLDDRQLAGLLTRQNARPLARAVERQVQRQVGRHVGSLWRLTWGLYASCVRGTPLRWAWGMSHAYHPYLYISVHA